MVPEGLDLEAEITLPKVWSLALDEFDSSAVLPQYLGEDCCRLFGTIRRGECEQFAGQVSNIDYDWYLRSMCSRWWDGPCLLSPSYAAS